MHWPMVTKDNCDTQRLLFSKDYCYTKSHDEMVTTEIDAHIPLNETQWEETKKEKESKRHHSPELEWR